MACMDCACMCQPCYPNTACVPVNICPAAPEPCPCDPLCVPCTPIGAVFKPVIRPAMPVRVCRYPPGPNELPPMPCQFPKAPCRPPYLPAPPCGECVIPKRYPKRPPALAPGGYCCPPFKTTTGATFKTFV